MDRAQRSRSRSLLLRMPGRVGSPPLRLPDCLCCPDARVVGRDMCVRHMAVQDDFATSFADIRDPGEETLRDYNLVWDAPLWRSFLITVHSMNFDFDGTGQWTKTSEVSLSNLLNMVKLVAKDHRENPFLQFARAVTPSPASPFLGRHTNSCTGCRTPPRSTTPSLSAPAV